MNRDCSKRPLGWLGALFIGAVWVAACNSPASPQVGSETHFLTRCDASCADGMQCTCGVCTRPCTGQAECDGLPAGASCTPLAPRVAEQRCGAAEVGAMCDATCLTDLDCSPLAPGRVCDAGYCREAGNSFAPPAPQCAPSNLAASEVLILGDVLIELSIFQAQLEQAAVAANVLPSGDHYRDQAAGASSLLATGPLSIDNEYTAARASGPARVIVMDGGATDVLSGQCAGMLTPDCPAALAAVSGAEQLFARFAQDHVADVVYFFYGDPVGNPTLKDGLDLLRPLLQNACGRSPVPCHWLDLRPAFAGHSEYVGTDGLVFTDAGATVAAAATFAFMQAQCVAN